MRWNLKEAAGKTLARRTGSAYKAAMLDEKSKPEVGGTVLYVKLVLRNDCVVISFHEDEGEDEI